MANVKKLDSKRRAVFPEPFVPGDVFVEEVSDTTIIYRLVASSRTPQAKIVTRAGKHFIQAPLDRDAIARAIRAERDER